jgi:hypothetical protein
MHHEFVVYIKHTLVEKKQFKIRHLRAEIKWWIFHLHFHLLLFPLLNCRFAANCTLYDMLQWSVKYWHLWALSYLLKTGGFMPPQPFAKNCLIDILV